MNEKQALTLLREQASRRLKHADAESLISHSLAVRDQVVSNGGSDIEITVAILHDLLEDTLPNRYLMVYDCYNVYAEELGLEGEVREAVVALSRRKGELYTDYIKRVMASGNTAINVKYADLQTNLKRCRADFDPDHALTRRYEKALKQIANKDADAEIRDAAGFMMGDDAPRAETKLRWRPDIEFSEFSAATQALAHTWRDMAGEPDDVVELIAEHSSAKRSTIVYRLECDGTEYKCFPMHCGVERGEAVAELEQEVCKYLRFSIEQRTRADEDDRENTLSARKTAVHRWLDAVNEADAIQIVCGAKSPVDPGIHATEMWKQAKEALEAPMDHFSPPVQNCLKGALRCVEASQMGNAYRLVCRARTIQEVENNAARTSRQQEQEKLNNQKERKKS